MLVRFGTAQDGKQVIHIHSTYPKTDSHDMRDIRIYVSEGFRLNSSQVVQAGIQELRVVACLGLLIDRDLGLLERDLLAQDEGKPITDVILRRATARKGLGWDLGKQLESIPQIRRPHFAVRWCEKGRQVPRLRPIKGSIVNRQKLSELPSGYESTGTSS